MGSRHLTIAKSYSRELHCSNIPFFFSFIFVIEANTNSQNGRT